MRSVFDELINYPEYRQHELKALWEFLGATDPPLDLQVLGVPTHAAPLDVLSESFQQSCAIRLVPRCKACAFTPPPPPPPPSHIRRATAPDGAGDLADPGAYTGAYAGADDAAARERAGAIAIAFANGTTALALLICCVAAMTAARRFVAWRRQANNVSDDESSDEELEDFVISRGSAGSTRRCFIDHRGARQL